MEPLEKRSRVSSELICDWHHPFCLDVKMDKSDGQPEHPVCVMEDEFILSGPTCRCYVGLLPDKRSCAKVLRKIVQLYSVPAHLKRVRLSADSQTSLDILICRVEVEGLHPDLPTDVINCFQRIDIVDVAWSQPRTRRQFECARKLWPVSFHEDRQLERLLNKQFFLDTELSQFGAYMRLAFQASKWCAGRTDATTGTSGGTRKSGAVAVDGRTGHVLAICSDHRGSHPLCHPAMVLIDLVASAQSAQSCYSFVRNLRTELMTPAAAAVASTNLRSTPTAPGDPDLPVYLLTGCSVFLTDEPCAMCAMALVHSRVARVFYARPTPGIGALGSAEKLHTCRQLNHRFLVFSDMWPSSSPD